MEGFIAAVSVRCRHAVASVGTPIMHVISWRWCDMPRCFSLIAPETRLITAHRSGTVIELSHVSGAELAGPILKMGVIRPTAVLRLSIWEKLDSFHNAVGIAITVAKRRTSLHQILQSYTIIDQWVGTYFSRVSWQLQGFVVLYRVASSPLVALTCEVIGEWRHICLESIADNQHQTQPRTAVRSRQYRSPRQTGPWGHDIPVTGRRSPSAGAAGRCRRRLGGGVCPQRHVTGVTMAAKRCTVVGHAAAPIHSASFFYEVM